MVRVVQEIDLDLSGDNLRLNLYQKLHNWQSPIMPPARQALAEPFRRISRKQTLRPHKRPCGSFPPDLPRWLAKWEPIPKKIIFWYLK
jgi:hypothetical protein